MSDRRPMTEDEFVELVEWILDRWGRDEVWANADRFMFDFVGHERPEGCLAWAGDECRCAPDGADVWTALTRHMTSTKSAMVPRPSDLKRRAIEVAREKANPARITDRQLPASTETYGWAEYARRTYGELVSIEQAIRTEHAKLPASPTEGKRHCANPTGCDLHGGTPDDESAFAMATKEDG